MKKALIISILISGMFAFGCNTYNTKSETLLIENEDKSVRQIKYTNPNDSVTWTIELDSLGNPLRLTSQEIDHKFKSDVEFEKMGMVKEVYLYQQENLSAKKYEFSNYKLSKISELILDDSQYLTNQWKLLNSQEDIKEDEGFFLDIDLNDTLTQNQKGFVNFKLKGRKSLRGVWFVINDDTIKTTSRNFSLKLDTETKGKHFLQGYVSNFDTLDEKQVVEFRIKFDEKYYVR